MSKPISDNDQKRTNPSSAHRKRALLVWSALILTAACLTHCTRVSIDEARFRQLLTGQQERYPQWQVPDLYKFIHQAALGSEHAVRDTAMARDWLTREIADLPDIAAVEPLIDTLSHDSRLARIHLRPFLQAGGSPDSLLAAFVRTANQFPGQPDMLRSYWHIAEQMAAEGLLSFSPSDLRTFFTDMHARDFPAVHHSELYRNTYQPAYRVVALEFISLP